MTKTNHQPDRRRFLSQAAVAASAVWLTGCFAKDSVMDLDGDSSDLVGASLRRARDGGKPLLVFVIPRDDGLKYARGKAFGALLNHGSTEALASLALCEVICAGVQDVAVHVAGVERNFEPLMILVETQGDTWVAKVIEDDLPVVDPFPSYEDRDKGPTLQDRLDALTAVLAATLTPDRATLESRVAHVQARLPRRELLAIEASFDTPAEIGTDLAQMAAPLLLLAARTNEDPELMRCLKQATEVRLVQGPPEGARWAVSTGCGVEIEGVEEEFGFCCGMGMSPALSRRFLYFLTKTPNERFQESCEEARKEHDRKQQESKE